MNHNNPKGALPLRFSAALITVLSALVAGQGSTSEMPALEHSHSTQPTAAHVHSKLEIPAGILVPAVDLDIAPDPMGGWNVQVKVKNFEFAPERVNQTSAVNEGHAHLYVNGKKVTRLYGSWHYLDKLPTGPHSVTVTLNTNRHEDLFYKGKRIEATKRFIVFPAGAGH
ncbi:hypothetical protein [Myxacorys almedinensis]|uniref:Uncharacterized protein n=1 Tax=Myxacorys almedinensis A TaxID=2690445 RepID=A0A8J7Z177_9CYAN|nr:hypothetical protein [Myxacorys almedinensis]NDJ18432.1 hypothetical protein [Myxacorys almedinensis A]